jgi:hypothetical protein
MRSGLRPRPSKVDESTGALLGFELDALGIGAGFGVSIVGLEVNREEMIWVGFAVAAVGLLLDVGWDDLSVLARFSGLSI